MKIFLSVIIVFYCSTLLAQDKKEHFDVFSYLKSKESGKGNIHFKQDSSITGLLNKYMEYCDIAKGFQGYRIRIFSNSGNNAREQANKCKNKFEAAYPDIPAYLQYKSPDFEVVIGDFRTKSEALKILKTIQTDFTSAFIIKTLIEYPKL